MAKGAVGLVAGYWPEDVYRYLAIPGIYLDEGLVTRPAKRFPEKVAVELGSQAITYSQLADATDRAMKAILSLSEGKSLRLALAVADPLELLPLFFGALRCHCMVLLPEVSATPERLLKQIASFSPDLVIADDSILRRISDWGEKTRAISLPGLYQLAPTSARVQKPLDRKAPAIALLGKGGNICYHSHNSALAGAISWSAFVPLREEDVVLNLQPVYTWEGLFGLLPALFRGATCIISSLEDPERVASTIVAHRCSYTWFTQEQARGLLQQPHPALVQAIGDNLLGVFVSLSGGFRPRSRKKLRNLLRGTPVLTVFGLPEAGPALASHPSWYLNESVGIPVSNVDVWPLNPGTGSPLQVPWESIEYAELGIRSPLMAAALHSREEEQAQIREGWLRSYMIASMDPNGMFYFRPELARLKTDG